MPFSRLTPEDPVINLAARIRDIPNFPVDGILFKDIFLRLHFCPEPGSGFSDCDQ